MAKIVVVEDDGALREDMVNHLTDWGHQVFQACDGSDGFLAIEECQPDLVISDIQMPNETGLDLVKRVDKLRTRYADMAFLFVSSMSAPKSVAHGIACGADDYITKPIDYSLLKVKIESMLRRRDSLIDMCRFENFSTSLSELMISSLLLVGGFGVLGVVVITALYAIKTVLGINIFVDMHFSDLF